MIAPAPLLLTLALASPLLWIGLLTRAALVKALLVLLALAGHRVWVRRRGGQSRSWIVLAGVLLWADGTQLWLASPGASVWQGIPVLLALAAVAESFTRDARSAAPSTRLRCMVGAAVAWLVLAGLSESAWSLSVTLPTALVVALFLWRLPQLLEAAEQSAGHWPLNALLITLALWVLAGSWQGWFAKSRFAQIEASPAPWEAPLTPEEIEALRSLASRHPQAGSESVLLVPRGLAAFSEGSSAEGCRLISEALTQMPESPAAIAAAAHVWGQMDALEALASRLTPAQVNHAGSLEAARDLAGALIAADDFGRARIIHTRFGDDLFTDDHPLLTPQRIGTALTAWGRPEEALQWFSSSIPAPWETAESLLWRGLALQALGRSEEAQAAWGRAASFAPNHADVEAHLAGMAEGPRTGVDLLRCPVAGRQLVEVTLTGVSPEVLPNPLVLGPRQVIDLDCAWRLTHVDEEEGEVWLSVGGQEQRLMTLTSTRSLVEVPDINLPDAVGERRRLGERVRSRATVTIPEASAWDLRHAQLVVSTPRDSLLPHREALDLAPLASAPAFRPVDQRAGQGISASLRLAQFGRGSTALGLATSLQGATSALQVFDPPLETRGLGLITALSGARQIPQGYVCAYVFLSDQRGRVWVFPLRAGMETADIWHEYPPYQADLLHEMAPIAWQTPRSSGGFDFPVTRYRTTLDLGGVAEIRALRVRSILPASVSLQVIDVVTLPAN